VLGPNRNVRLSWPTTAAGFRLEESSSLGLATWTTVASAPVVEGNDNVIRITPGAGARFYRLVR
ncbi:MAG: hypothetical protein HYY23_19590, partial [Verrucomicrobia bacterium]|nr:hypothetical protein [Verrucomicrobiota bacterium]